MEFDDSDQYKEDETISYEIPYNVSLYESKNELDERDQNSDMDYFLEIFSRMSSFNGENATDEEISAVVDLANLITESNFNFSKQIFIKNIFPLLIDLGNCVKDNIDAFYQVIRCISVITGKDYQNNSFFKSNFSYFELTLPFLHEPALIQNILISYTNIIFEQDIICNYILKKLPPSEIRRLCEQYSTDLNILLCLARLISACSEWPNMDERLLTSLFQIASSLLDVKINKDDIGESDKQLFAEYQLISLYTCNQCILANQEIVKNAAGDEEFIKKIMDILNDFYDIRVAEYCLAIIGHLACEENFPSSLINNEMLFQLFRQDDESFCRVFNKCLRNLNVNGRLLLCQGDYLYQKIEIINQIIENSAFTGKEEMANSLQIVLSRASNQFISELIKYNFFSTLHLLKDLDSKNGIKYFFQLCRIILRAPLGISVEQSREVLDFMDSEEILQFIDEVADGEKNDEDLETQAQLTQSMVTNLIQFVEENS